CAFTRLRHRRELAAGQALQCVATWLALRTHGDGTVALHGQGDVAFGHHLDALEKITCTDGDRSHSIDLPWNAATDGQVQVRRGQSELSGLASLDEHISQHG